jgi:indole-3-glycerol phosphate synthase
MILDDIVKDCRVRLEASKNQVSLAQIKEMASHKAVPVDMAKALCRDRISIIAEVKKASPSKGLICRDFNPIEIARSYAEGGAAAISILTEVDHFQGSLNYLSDIDQALGINRPPLLRKDFLFEPYQIYEARAFGADALLLIAAILTLGQLQELLGLSHQLKMQCLVEVHNADEAAAAVDSGAEIIGINNRDLRTFAVDLATTERLLPLIPAGKIVVSESGIRNRADIDRLGRQGVTAVLIGETLMASGDIAAKMRELV